jgi:hypothetical protein
MNQLFINTGGPIWQLLSMMIMLVPVAIILIKQKGGNSYFQSLAAANLLFFISACIMNKYVALPVGMVTLINGLSIIMNAPLTLAFLLYFIEQTKNKKAIRNSLAIVLGIVVLSLCFSNYSSKLALNLMLIGSVPVFIFSSILFIQYTISGVYEKKDGDKAFLLGTIVFAYGSYLLLLALNMISPEKHVADLQSLFGLITIISSGFISLGIAMLDQRKKEINITPESKPKKLDAGFAQWDNFNFY